MSAGDHSGELSFPHYGKLIEILARHHFKCFADRCVRRNRMNLIQRSHHIAECRVGPLRSLNCFDFTWRDQALRLPVKRDYETPPPGPYQMLLNESLHVRVPVHRRVIGRHHICNTHTAKRLSERDLRVALTRSIKQKPTDECDP